MAAVLAPRILDIDALTFSAWFIEQVNIAAASRLGKRLHDNHAATISPF